MTLHWACKLLHLFNDKNHVNGFCIVTHTSSIKSVIFNSVSIPDLTTSKYSIRTSQLTKIQNRSGMEKKTVLKSFFDFQ